MPEMKHNFIKGRMNKDLDERLVPDGEYREAMNIEVATSESSNVGTVQTVMGNTRAYNNINFATGSNIITDDLSPNGGSIVGSYADGKSDKIYLLIHCNEYVDLEIGKIKKDMIVEYHNGVVIPVIVDIYEVTSRIVVDGGQGTFPNLANYISISNLGDPSVNITQVRNGMKMAGTLNAPPSWAPVIGGGWFTAPQQLTLTQSNSAIGTPPFNYGPFNVKKIANDPTNNAYQIYIGPENIVAFPLIPSTIGDELTFYAKRVLNFAHNRLITGINIIDDFLFWTDNHTEPKQINIKKCKQGTPLFNRHSKFTVHDNNGAIVQPQKPLEEEHITVIKRSPLTAPNLEMYDTIDGRGSILGKTARWNFSTEDTSIPPDIVPPAVGSSHDVPFVSFTMPDYKIGDILIFTNDSNILESGIWVGEDYKIRGIVTDISISGINTIVKLEILSLNPGFLEFEIDNSVQPALYGEPWMVYLEQSKPLFEFKFPKFAYRYKYQDGEYSAFSPFSEVAFLPGPFTYNAKEGYNLGMTNTLRLLNILDFIPDAIPKGVVSVDILYKESNSPNIYTVKTIKREDPEWNVSGSSTVGGITKGKLQLESEMIYATVASNQLLRPWDNVPRKALGQEISGNRLVYGNYLQNYNIPSGGNNTIDISSYIRSSQVVDIQGNPIEVNQPGKSIKSLRTYQIGIVYKDEYGRETPVLTNESASFNIAKQQADNNNQLSVQIKHQVPDWVHSHKFFIKETSNEYYNLAMDRWYDAEDGNIWVSFASADRNKVQEDTFLILKKRHDVSTFVPEEARYKIIAISNEVPTYVKTERVSWGAATANAAAYTPSDSIIKVPAWDDTQFENQIEGEKGLRVRLIGGTEYSDWYEVKSIRTNSSQEAFIQIRGTFGDKLHAQFQTTITANFEITQEKIRMKPEFDGRFFVKLSKDGILEEAVQSPSQDTDPSFTVTASFKQYYMKGTDQNNNWCKYNQWWNTSSSWTDRVGRGFYIDQINRDWGSYPTQGPYPSDRGYGITGDHPNFKGYHINLSLSGINDDAKNSFSISSHSKEQKDAYNKMIGVGTLFRWKEDPNGIIYQIRKTKHKGTDRYDSQHGVGIFNYSASNKRRKWKSNKTRRIYMKIYATGWMYAGLTEGAAIDPSTSPLVPFAPGSTTADSANHTYKYYSEMEGYPPPWATYDDQKYHPSGMVTFTGTNPLPKAFDPLKSGTVPSIASYPNDPTLPVNTHAKQLASSPQGVSIQQSDSAPPISSVSVVPNKHVNIEFVEKYSPDSEQFSSTDPGIFETEPKEDVGLDIYHEIDQAFPNKLSGGTNELFIPYGSTITSDVPGVVLQESTVVTPLSNAIWNIGDTTLNSNQIALNASADHWVEPGMIIEDSVGGACIPLGTIVEDVSGVTLTISNAAISTCLQNTFTFTKISPAVVTGWDENRLTLSCDPNDPVNVQLPANIETIPHAFVFTRPDGSTVTADITNLPAGIIGHNIPAPSITSPYSNVWLALNPNVANSKVDLTWHNCYSFGNGVESDRIRDDYNAVRIDKGVKASTTLAEKYEEERRCNGFIYSGIYNSISGINRLNQFIQAEKITKDLNPRFGCIQKLHARDTDLITLCEDKVLKLLANKDAVYNADGNPQLVATDRVLGQAVPFPGEFGISKNPESFATQAFRSYFTDKQRGVVLRLSRDGLVPISDHGMKDWFADNLRASRDRLVGSYDVKKDSYNVTLRYTSDSFYGLSPNNYVTVSFTEKTNGWTSFKSFIQNGGISLNNNYFTFKNGEMYMHHMQNVNIATFYGARVDPYVDILFNESPGSIKSFGSLNYEGSQAKITQNLTDGEYYNNVAKNGWYLESGETDLQSTSLLEFKDKEGKWFSRMKGMATNLSNIDTKEFSFQGIDIASSVIIGTIPSWNCYNFQCTDPGDGSGQYSSLIDCETVCIQPPPIPPSWNCLNSGGFLTCTDPGDGSGIYSTLTACQAVCGVTQISFDCINGACIDPGTGNGQYTTLLDCQNACLVTTSWDCDSATGNCYDPGTGNGAFTTLTQCQNACVAPIYGCMDDGITIDPVITAQRPPGWVGPATNYYAGAQVHDGTCIYLQNLTIQDDLTDH